MDSSIDVVCYVAVAVPSLVGGNALIRRAGSGRAATHPGVPSLPRCPAAAPMATDVGYADER